ncbi:MAG: hypothetical protein OHK0012_11150 [Synechococcales cyanobacterium]
MTVIYRCKLELHDYLYYATRELGRLYETEAVIHNYALCYALGFVDNEKYGTQVDPQTGYRYFCAEQVPQYAVHLEALNRAGIYVTPAGSLGHQSALHTWKYASNAYHVEMEPTSKNIPSFGRAKEIAPESEFGFYILARQEIEIPHWIRLGKWMSKAEVSYEVIGSGIKPSQDTEVYRMPLNPLDVMFRYQVMSYDVINMPPVSLIQNVRLQGSFYKLKDVTIPADLQFRFS